MQDDFNEANQPPNDDYNNNLSPPNSNNANINTPISSNNPNQSPTPIGMRTIEPINTGIVPEPMRPINNIQNQPDLNTPMQNTTRTAPELNPLSLGADLVPPKKSKKKLIILISSIVVVMLIGGGAAAFYFWYQSPQKVVSDSLIYAVTSKASIYSGNVVIDNDGTKLAVDIKGKQLNSSTGSVDASIKVTYGGKDYNTSGSVIYGSKGDIYFKIADLKKIADEFMGAIGLTGSNSNITITNATNDLVKRIDGVWIKISSSDLKEFSQSYAASKTCFDTAVDKFKDDKKAITEVTDLYTKNQFIVVDKSLGQKDGSLGFQIKGDESKAKSFVEGLKNTTIYKSLHGCDNTFAINSSDINLNNSSSTANATTELWVDVWSHKPTKLAINAKNNNTSVSATIKTDYNSKVEITDPSDSVSLSRLKTYIEEFTDSISSTLSSSL